MPNYQDGKIYKIYNTINDDIYIGSTTQKLCGRMRNHRRAHKSKHHFNYPIYKALREHGVDNYFIELIEKCPCNDIEELRGQEGEYIRSLKPSLDIRIGGRTTKEYYEDNKDIILQKQREYAENNREKILQRHRGYYDDNRDILSQKSKDYRENNREKILQKHRDYYQQNREVRIEYSAKYQNEHKEERHEHNKQYRESHKEQIFKTR